MKRYRILFEGTNWFGSNALSSSRALLRLGHLVNEVDFATVIPESWGGLELRVVRRLIMPLCQKEHNRNLLRLAREFKPHMFLAYKGANILPSTLAGMRQLGVPTFNYYPDVSAFAHRYAHLSESLPLYDCVFSTKTFLQGDLRARGIELRHCVILPHAYDPEPSFPIELAPEEGSMYAADVVFIGTWSPKKEVILAGVKRAMPALALAIWGQSWEKAGSPELRDSIRGRPVLGLEYTQALRGAKIALGLLSEIGPGASQGDEVTSRTFNIPPAKVLMLHERTEELGQFFAEGKEVACYSTSVELAEKIAYYLARPEEAAAMAEAAYARCVPAYSYDRRMGEIIAYFEANC